MFALTESMRYYFYEESIDMRKGIPTLYLLVKNGIGRNPVSGDVFLFLGKRRNSIKILHWENGGFVLYQKNLEQGFFERPGITPDSDSEISWKYFVLMIEGVRLKSARFNKRFHL